MALLRQESLQTSADTEITKAAGTRTGIETGKGVMIGAIGPLPGITEVTGLADTEMNVITGPPETETGCVMTQGIVTGETLGVQTLSNGQGLKNHFCHGHPHQGLCSHPFACSNLSLLQLCLSVCCVTFCLFLFAKFCHHTAVNTSFCHYRVLVSPYNITTLNDVAMIVLYRACIMLIAGLLLLIWLVQQSYSRSITSCQKVRL